MVSARYKEVMDLQLQLKDEKQSVASDTQASAAERADKSTRSATGSSGVRRSRSGLSSGGVLRPMSAKGSRKNLAEVNHYG